MIEIGFDTVRVAREGTGLILIGVERAGAGALVPQSATLVCKDEAARELVEKLNAVLK